MTLFMKLCNIYFPFKTVCIHQFSKIMSRAIIKNQKVNPISHFIGLCREHDGSVPISD